MMHFRPFGLLFQVIILCSASTLQKAPIAFSRNGTYKGIYSSEFKQDFFLGIPYAQPPTGDLRFRNPQSLVTKWHHPRPAVKYSPACVGYGPSQIGYNVSEDCLYLNVVRPTGITPKSKLPVAVWIHGGAFTEGSGVDLRYNMSFIVQQSQEMKQPILAVTINYRLSAWGFLQGYPEEGEQGNNIGSNWGLRDQRLALHWVQENIQAFGGKSSWIGECDPTKVTIWGQSAGAASVGIHLLAYNGRNDQLFRSAIMESGNPLFLGAMNRTYEPAYNNLTILTGCNNATSSLECLRALSFEQLNAAINTTALTSIWTSQLDGDIIARYSSDQIAEGDFVKVPIISGANSDEGTSLAPKGLNTTNEFLGLLTSSSTTLNTSFAERILAAYPLTSSENDLANLGSPDFILPAYPYGLQYRRTTTYYTDSTFVANRRLTCQTWASHSLPAYCYNFNAIPAWAGSFDGATHFAEVAFAMKNIEGVGYAPIRTPPFEGLGVGYKELAILMAGDWVAFISKGDPNAWNRRAVTESLGEVPMWEEYGVDAELFNYQGNKTCTMKPDTWRAEGMELINSASKAVYDR